MDAFESVSVSKAQPVPDKLRNLFNHPDDVKVQKLPCGLPDEGSMAVHFAPGARTVPHTHHNGQHLVIVDGVGVVADDTGVHVVQAGDVVSSPPGGWHWHGAAPDSAMTHVTVEHPVTSTSRWSVATGTAPTSPSRAPDLLPSPSRTPDRRTSLGPGDGSFVVPPLSGFDPGDLGCRTISTRPRRGPTRA